MKIILVLKDHCFLDIKTVISANIYINGMFIVNDEKEEGQHLQRASIDLIF